MKRLLVLMTLPIFFSPLTIVSTEMTVPLTNQEQASFFAEPAAFEQVPKNPRLVMDTLAYQDRELTQLGQSLSANQPLTITRLLVNDQLLPVFELSTGQYLPASQLLLFDDQVLSHQPLNQTLWLGREVRLYDRPFVLGAKILKTKLSPYQKVTVVEQAQTYSGTYYRIEGQGWIAAEGVFTTDMAALQDLLTTKYQSPKLAIYVKRLDDQSLAEVNSSRLMYGASIAKLATIYETQRQLQVGQIKLTDHLSYIEAVNDYKGAYDPAGTGRMSKTPDHKSYTVEDLLKALSQSSDNVASNMLGYYVAKQYDSEFQREMADLAGADWDMSSRQLSAASAGRLMEALYAQDGQVLSWLSETDFDQTRIAKGIDVRVAHKTGDAYDFRHDVAIVYADRPFILSIFTEDSTYEDITRIAEEIYQLLR